MKLFGGRKSEREAREKARRERRRRQTSARLKGEESPSRPAKAEPTGTPKTKSRTAAKAGKSGESPESGESKRTRVERKRGRKSPRNEKQSLKNSPSAGRPRSKTSGARSKGSRPKTSGARAQGLRSKMGPALSSSRKAAGEGLRATQRRARAARPAISKNARKAGGIAVPLIAIPLLVLAFAEKCLRTVFRLLTSFSKTVTDWLDRVLTPARGTFLVVLAACIGVGLSQGRDFSGVEVGQPGYADVAGIVDPERVNLLTPVDAHGIWLWVIAIAALALAAAAMATGRWRLAPLISLAGLAGLAVTLLVDRGKGLEEGEAAVTFAGTNAVLLEGYYAQLASCVVLAIAGLLLTLHLRRDARRRPARRSAEEKSDGRRRRLPTLAGSRT